MKTRYRMEGFQGQRIVVLPRRIVESALSQALLRGLLATDAGYFPRAQGHFMERPAGVDQAIFIYCVKGAGWCEMDATRRPIGAGQLLIVPPGAPHAYGADEKHPWTISWVHAKGDNVQPLLAELEITRTNCLIDLGEDTQLLGLFEELLDIMEYGYATPHLLYASQVLTHLVGLMIWHRRRAGRNNLDASQKVAQSIAYMKQHLDQLTSAASLAAVANLSESHYRTLFKQQTGYSPSDYFVHLRMHKACQLLDTTMQSVKEIADRVGYQDPLYFSRVFKAVMDLPPTQYRLMRKG